MKERNLVVIDIDGVMADYRLGLLWWINTNYPNLREICYTHLARTDTWLNHETMKVTFREWLDILEQFRMSGGKLTIPVFPHANAVFDMLHKAKLKPILITSRPIDICPNIYHDTVEWLRQNKFDYHMLLWSKNKAEMIYKMRLIDEICFAIDDELGHVIGYLNLRIPTYWVNHYHKSHPLQDSMLMEVSNLKEVIESYTGGKLDA
jgi:hypothetical protein